MSKRIVSIIVFPGSNCDRDLAVALENNLNVKVKYVWHDDSRIENHNLIFIPGGFSYGDYLRAGVLATKSPAIKEVIRFSKKGYPIIGICNGFQILTECNLLPGTLLNNENQMFICEKANLKVESCESIFSRHIGSDVVQYPIAHAQGKYFTSNDNLKKLEDNNQIIFKYCSETGIINRQNNPNGSLNNIAGIVNKKKNILGMMPHPERAVNKFEGQDGVDFFLGLKELL